MHRAARTTFISLAGACLLSALAVPGCERATEPGPDRYLPTAIAWLEPVAAPDVDGRFTFVARASGVRVTGRAEGLAPDVPHVLSLYDVEHCSRLDDARPSGVVARITPDREGRVAYDATHPDLPPVDGGTGLSEQALVVADVASGTQQPVACGRVRFIGDLTATSGGHYWHGTSR